MKEFCLLILLGTSVAALPVFDDYYNSDDDEAALRREEVASALAIDYVIELLDGDDQKLEEVGRA